MSAAEIAKKVGCTVGLGGVLLIPVPNDPSLEGLQFYLQGFLVSFVPAWNSMGISLGEPYELTIGY